jgi:cholest-4-en-3-one 26-monooxygenase
VSTAEALTEIETFDAGVPHALFDELRSQSPQPSGVSQQGERMVSVCRHADIAAISRDPATFSSARAGIFPNKDQVNALEVNRNLLLFMDPPEHTKYRKILQTAFVPNSVNKLEDGIRATFTELLDGVIDIGRCDFVTDIAVPYPLTVLSDLMGLPREDLPQLEDWIDRIEAAQISGVSNEAAPVLGEMTPYLLEQIQRQTAEGGDSLVTKLASAEVDGERLTELEILVFFALLVFAGNDTTRNTLSGGMRALLEHPDQLELLRAEPERIPGAVEEILRWTSVVNYFCRTATEDTEVAGCPVHEGEKVMIWYAAGSRDPEANPDPQRFDVTREEVAHMAFGGGGRHFCLGAGLARLELRIALEEILDRLADIELHGEPERLRSNWANALTSLPIKFTPST